MLEEDQKILGFARYLTDDLTQARFFKVVDASYYYEEYSLYQTGEL
ncbi:hypothetical protein [Streptococcus australis]|nr:hypothetical protein [Streptococcus australis]